MTRPLALTAALCFAIFLAMPAQAAEQCWTTSLTDDREIVVEVPGGENAGSDYVHYIVTDTFCVPGLGDASCLFSIWTYGEMNGLPGLQRGDEVKSDIANCTDGTVSDADYNF